jgi:hypothetical protein
MIDRKSTWINSPLFDPKQFKVEETVSCAIVNNSMSDHRLYLDIYGIDLSMLIVPITDSLRCLCNNGNMVYLGCTIAYNNI